MLLALAIVLAQQVTVGATVNARRIGIEDVLQLTVSISGGEPSAEPVLPDLPEFRVAGRSTSSQIQIVNGQMSSTRSYIYQLLPRKEGKFVIGAVHLEVSGENHETDPIEVEIVAGSLGSGRPRGRSLDPFDSFSPFGRRRDSPPDIDEADVFVRTEVSKRSVFLGEQVVVTYRVFSRYVPLGPELDDDPPLEGFWVEEVDPGTEPAVERRTIDGKPYIVFPIKQRVVFPTATGTLTIPPMTFSMAFRVTSSDPFDAFFSRASAPVTVRSSPVPIDVLPLPAAGRARDFAGAVGEFELKAKLNKESVPAGQAVTLTVSIEGRGNLRSVDVPALPELSGFRAFDPKTEEHTVAGASGLAGSKTWEYVLVPESAGVKELGPWSFQYFDPEREKYVSASVGPLELVVEGGVAAGADPSSTAPPRGDVTVLREDIRYLKDPPDQLGASDRPFHESALFYWSLALPVLWNLAFVVYLRRREKRRLHSDVFRSRRAHRTARKRLKKAAKLANVASRDFYEEIAAALYRYVGDKLSLSPSGLTSSTIDELLEGRNVPEDTRRELTAVLEKCEEARFSPGRRTREEMSALRERAEALLVSLARQLG